MRIVHVTDAYLPHLGGIETQVADLAARQRAAGHDVHVVTSTASAGLDDADEPGEADEVGVHRLPGGWWRESVAGSFASARVVRSLEPDVVHCHNSVLSPLAVNVAVNASASGVPTAVTVHSILPSVGPLLPASGFLLAVRSNGIAWSAVSEVAATPLRRLLGGARVEVLPNAVDVDWWRAAAVRRHDDACVRIVSVGRLALRKRVLPLVRIVDRVRRSAPPGVVVELVLAGDGPQRQRVRREVAARSMTDEVELPGRLDRTSVRELLARSDLYVAPARLESFGIAALEARSVGLPVLARSASGVSAFVEQGRAGVLVRDDRAMVAALSWLVADRPAREGMRAHNRQVPPAASWADVLARTDRLYARAAHLATDPSLAPRPVPVRAYR